MIKTENILVTGGNGRLGQALGALGCTALGREELDITSPDSISSAIEKHTPRLVINCAAYTAVDRAEDEPEKAFAINRDGAANIAAACAGPRIPLIHTSTDCVFGDSEITRQATEEDAPSPLSVYGQSKLDGERAVRAAGRQRVCITRLSWLFDASEETFIGKMLATAQARDTLKLADDTYGRPTPVSPLTEQMLKLAGRILDGMPVPEILHLGPRNPVSRYQWAKSIFVHSDALGGPMPKLSPCSSDELSEAARRPRSLILDVATANALLGAMPDWRDATAEAVAQLLAKKTKA